MDLLFIYFKSLVFYWLEQIFINTHGEMYQTLGEHSLSEPRLPINEWGAQDAGNLKEELHTVYLHVLPTLW